ncbi:hypothetical protein E3N88_29541 [Mikania micrantha]|uniref:Integrase catalytic domain-containing protein n=1 Tax=Mikania micrantha TaxID=192012 RepID=A0A5N6MJP5_9ASTR|nr:hypothetical protein E3N88_29541 [Mikania micrantha]
MDQVGLELLDYVPSIKSTILQEAHDTPVGGHGGFLKTYKRVKLQFFWPNLKRDVRLYEDISLDFIVGLPVSHRVDTIFVVVDRLSKYAHFLPLKHPFTAKAVERVRLHGFPHSIVSDRDTIFLSNFWQELFRLGHTSLKMSTSYDPQTDGQTEVVNRCLEAYLRCIAHEQPLNWSSFLSWAEYSYNTGFHTFLRTTPFNVVYGRDPPTLHPYVPGDTNNAELESQLITRDQMLQLLRTNLQKAQDRILIDRKAWLNDGLKSSLPARGVAPSTPAAPLPITKDWEVDLQPAKVLSHRWRTVHHTSILDLLILWATRPMEEATWEE